MAATVPSYQVVLPGMAISNVGGVASLVADPNGCAFSTTTTPPIPPLPPLPPIPTFAAGGVSLTGGFTSAGMLGSYYTDGAFSQLARTRRDVRIRFPATEGIAGGTTEPGYVGTVQQGQSVRWVGQIKTVFSEPFTFMLASDGARLMLRKAGDTTFTTVVDSAMNPAQTGGTFPLVADTLFDIVVELPGKSALPFAVLSWYSPSTPLAVIGPMKEIGVNLEFIRDYDPVWQFADLVKSARQSFYLITETNGAFYSQRCPCDSSGWPTTDGKILVDEGMAIDAGVYAISLTGQATVAVEAFSSSFTTVMQPWNAATNQTIGTITKNDGTPVIWGVKLTNTKRTATSATNSGITNLKIMRPVPGSLVGWYDPTTIFDQRFLDYLAPFTFMRCMPGTNGNTSSTWDSGDITTDRTRPDWFTQAGPPRGTYEGNGCSYEYRVMLANKLGKDLYLNIPVSATPDYVAKLANLIKNGGTVNGVFYQPLNANLNCYLEFGNELWNFSFPQAGTNQTAASAAVGAGTPEGLTLNYDGSNNVNDYWRRRIALQTQKISATFRQVFGDAAMGDRIRVLLQAQRDDINDTMNVMLNFLNEYFNNGDGVAHVVTPHPVSYWIYGGGGQVYYSTSTSSTSKTVDDIFAGTGPYVGDSPYGTILARMARWPIRYNLKPVSYEGGLSLFGDTTPIPTWAATAKFDDARTRPLENSAFDMFFAAGMAATCRGTYPEIRDYAKPVTTFPLVQATLDQSSTLPALGTNGVTIPGVLNAANQGVTAHPYSAAKNWWLSWQIVVPVSGTYTFAVASTNPKVDILINDSVAWSGPAGGIITLNLPRGIHSLVARTPGVKTLPVTITATLVRAA